MKQLMISLFLMFVTSVTFGQATSEQLKTNVDEYMAYSKALDSDNIIEYINPKLFNVVSKEELKQSMDMVLNVPGMKISIDDISVDSISDIKTINDSQFAIIDYSAVTSMQLTSEEAIQHADNMITAFQQQFGADNVKFSKNNNTIFLNAKKQMVGEFVNDKWTFIDYDVNSPQMMELVFDEQTRQELFQ